MTPSLRRTLVVLASTCAALCVFTLPLRAGVWRSVGPYGGTVTVLAVSPSDPRTVLAGTAADGVFRSANRGASWRRLLDTPYLRAFAISPSNPAVLYAGGSYSLHRSVDGGAHWQSIQTGLENQEVNALAVHPTRPAAVYVAVQTSAAGLTGGVFRSLDAGAHWARLRAGLPAGNAYAVALAPADPSRVLAGFPRAGVFRSADAGLHWSEANAGLATFDVTAVAPDPERPGTVYAGPLEIGVVKTTDAGETWRIVNSRLRGPWAFSMVELDPRDSSIVYASIPGRLERSDDGGAHWRRVDLPLRNSGFTGLIAFAPDAVLYAAGNHNFKTADRGETWEQVADLSPECSMTPHALAVGLAGIFVSALPGDPTRCPFLHLGIFRSTDAGAHWTAVRDWVRRLAVDPVDPQVAYALDDSFHLFKSTDGGATFALLRTDPFFGADALAVDPASSRLYVGGPGYVFTSGDGGATWQRVGDPFEAVVFDVAPDPAVPGRLWAGTDRGIYVYDAD
jgi:photosystem II stability/assembly factor-like uncharacterized protein